MPDLVALVPRYSVTCPHYHIVVSPFSYARPLGPKCIPRYLLALLEVCRYIHYQKRNSPVPTPRPRKPNRPTAGSHPQNALRALHSPLPRCEASQEFSEKKPTRNIKKLPPKKNKSLSVQFPSPRIPPDFNCSARQAWQCKEIVSLVLIEREIMR